MPADIDSVIEVLNRNLRYGWGITALSSDGAKLFKNTYGHHPRITQISLSNVKRRRERITLFHVARSDNSTDGVLAFDWSIERNDNTVCLYHDYHFLILGSLPSENNWPSWMEDLRNALNNAWKTQANILCAIDRKVHKGLKV